MSHITILHDVILALDSAFAGGADGGFGFVFHQVADAVDFGLDELFLKVSAGGSHAHEQERHP